MSSHARTADARADAAAVAPRRRRTREYAGVAAGEGRERTNAALVDVSKGAVSIIGARSARAGVQFVSSLLFAPPPRRKFMAGLARTCRRVCHVSAVLPRPAHRGRIQRFRRGLALSAVSTRAARARKIARAGLDRSRRRSDSIGAGRLARAVFDH